VRGEMGSRPDGSGHRMRQVVKKLGGRKHGLICFVRCRKKMKRVERRGTIEQAQQQAQLANLQHNSSAASLHPGGSSSPTHHGGAAAAAGQTSSPYAHHHHQPPPTHNGNHHQHHHPPAVSLERPRGSPPHGPTTGMATHGHTHHGNSRAGAVRTPPPIVVESSASIPAGNGSGHSGTNGIGGIGQARPRLIRPPSPPGLVVNGALESQQTEVSEDELRPSSVDADADADPDELEGEEVDELRQEKEEDDFAAAVDAAEANSGSEKSSTSPRV
jgi:hypothetical protein